jgi:TrmH family RNA methyltransferase
VLALDRVADPGNVGTLLRAAAFYGVREVWLGTGSAEAHSPKVLRAAMAAHLHLRVCEQVNLAAELAGAKRSGARVLAAEMEGVERSAGSLPGRGAGQVLVLGSEAHGVDPALIELADERLAIARRGPIDSLNVAMAGTVLLDRLLPFTEQTTP